MPSHGLPSTQAFVDAAQKDMGPALDEIQRRWTVMSRRRGDILSSVRERVQEVGARLRARERA